MKSTIFLSLSFAMWLVASASGQVPTFQIATAAGTGTAGDSGDGGVATAAELNGPRGVTEDIYGNLYIAEYYGERVRKVTPAGIITTLAGTGAAGYSGDGGPAVNAKLNGPYRVTVDSAGNVYIPDSGNSRVRMVSPSGIITTVVGNGNIGSGGDGGQATNATLNYPEAVAFDSAGDYYVADEGANVVRLVSTAGIITTAVGTGSPNYTGDNGPAASATLDGPVGIAVDSAGDLYISDQGNNVIRKVTNGTITTYAGNGVFGFGGDGGPAIKAEFAYPASIGLDAAGNLYIPDVNNSRIRVVLLNGTIITVAGNGNEAYTGDNGPAISAAINVPRSVSVAPNGNVYIGDFGNNVVRVLTPIAVTGTPVIDNGGVTGDTDFGNYVSFAPGGWLAIYGANLAVDSRQWATTDFVGNDAPISLDGTSVTINGQNGFVSYISPGQVNVQFPSGLPTGVLLLTVTTPTGTSATYQVVVKPAQPQFLASSKFDINGTQYIVGVHTDGSYVLPAGAIPGVNSRPASPGETIVFFGVGFGPVTPNIPAGQIVQQQNTLASSLGISIGGQPATLAYDGLAESYVGLYQFNVVVPQGVSGTVPVTWTFNGATGAQTFFTVVQ